MKFQIVLKLITYFYITYRDSKNYVILVINVEQSFRTDDPATANLTMSEVLVRIGSKGNLQDQNEAGDGNCEKHALDHTPQPPVAA